jgi:hypothetical protein
LPQDAAKILDQMGGGAAQKKKEVKEYPKIFVEPTIPGRRGLVFTDTSGAEPQFPKVTNMRQFCSFELLINLLYQTVSKDGH